MHLQKIRATTKILFWCLFFLQIILLGIYWFYQQENETPTENYLIVGRRGEIIEKHDDFVYFITKKLRKNSNKHLNTETLRINLESQANFDDDFYIFMESGKNFKENITCYRQGTAIDMNEENNFTVHKNIQECHCKAEWHGKDCAQPEIIWRALMTSKVRPLKNDLKYPELLTNKIIYMITGHFISLDILEIQLIQLSKSVDFFILCQKPFSSKNIVTSNLFLNKESLGKKLKLKISTWLYKKILIFDDLILSNSNNSKRCTPKLAYKEFKSKLSNIDNLKPNDIFLFSEDDEILNNKAIKYFQYTNDRPFGVTRFRLKYNVYGFFWQHPIGTKISSALCSIKYLEKNYKSDPERLLNIKKPTLIIGDLNHIGGWFCRYCYQPNEIVDKLMIESAFKLDSKKILVPRNVRTNEVNFPKKFKNGQIDSNYIQNLIASGLYIDGKLGLTKQHRYSDKYYSPKYVEDSSWRFNNILVNMFISFNDDYDYRK